MAVHAHSQAGALAGRVVVVTGGGAGIGLGIVQVLANQDAIVVMAECNPAGKDIADRLLSNGLKVQWIACDVSNPHSISQMFDAVQSQYGRLDGLVSNAGLTIHEDFLSASLENWQRLMDTNLRSVFLCAQSAAKLMCQSGGGSIVNVASNHAGATMEGFEAYAATKGGICSMTRAMAWSLGQYGIRVNSLSPGLTSTDHIAQLMQDKPHLKKFYPSLHATRRINTPEDVGRIAAFLLSEASAGITGEDLLADNGMSAHLFNRYES